MAIVDHFTLFRSDFLLLKQFPQLFFSVLLPPKKNKKPVLEIKLKG